MTPSMPRTLVRALFQSGLIASTLTSAAAFAEASDASTSDFASAGPAWVSPELPVGSSGSTAAWDNTLAGVYELALRNDPVLAAAEATFRAGSEERRIGLGGLLPQVNAEYSIVDVDQDSDGAFAAGAQVFPNQTESEVDQTDWALRLQQPLFNVSAWFNFRRGAELT